MTGTSRGTTALYRRRRARRHLGHRGRGSTPRHRPAPGEQGPRVGRARPSRPDGRTRRRPRQDLAHPARHRRPHRPRPAGLDPARGVLRPLPQCRAVPRPLRTDRGQRRGRAHVGPGRRPARRLGRQRQPLRRGLRQRGRAVVGVHRRPGDLQRRRAHRHRTDDPGYRPGQPRRTGPRGHRARHRDALDHPEPREGPRNARRPTRPPRRATSARRPASSTRRRARRTTGRRSTPTDPAFEGKHLPYAVCGYVPSQLRSTYGVSATRRTGRGQTVAITDAFAAPTIEKDANTYASPAR